MSGEWSWVLGVISIVISSVSIFALIRYYIDRKKECIKEEIRSLSKDIFKDDFVNDLTPIIIKKKVLTSIWFERILFSKIVHDLPNILNYKNRIYVSPIEFTESNIRKYITYNFLNTNDTNSSQLIISKKLYAFTESDDDNVLNCWQNVSYIEIKWLPISQDIMIQHGKETIIPKNIKLMGINGVDKNDLILSQFYPEQNQELQDIKLLIPGKILRSLKKELKHYRIKDEKQHIKNFGKRVLSVNIYIFKKKPNSLNLRFSTEFLLYLIGKDRKCEFQIKQYKWNLIKRLLSCHIKRQMFSKCGIKLVTIKG